MPRLPTVGGDSGTWGAILNDWLGKGGRVFDAVAGYQADNTGASDAAAAINTALTAAAGIGTVFIPAGTYLISSSQIFIPSNTTLLMHPQTYLKRSFAGASTVLNLDTVGGNSNITLIGGNFGLSGTPAGQHIAFINVTNLQVLDCWLGDTVAGAWMTWFQDVHNVVISNCIFKNSLTTVALNDGLHLISGDHISVSNCYIATGDDAIALGSTGMTTNDLHDVVIDNCTLYAGLSRAIAIYAQAAQNVYGIEVSNVAGFSNSAQALELQNYFDTSQARVHDIHISNCRFTSPASATFAMVAQYISRLFLHQVDFPAQSIDVVNCTDVTLSECHASSHAAASALVQVTTVTRFNIHGGIYDGQAFSTDGILAGSVTGGSWIGVTVRDCVSENLNLNDCTGLRIIGCDLSNSVVRNAGVYERGASDYNRIENCDLRNNTYPAYLGTSGGGIAHSRYAGNIGYNPKGIGFTNPSAPTVAASGTAVTNNTGADCMVRITCGAGVSVSVVAIGGTTITGLTVSASTTSSEIRVPAGQTITLTYAGGTPTWQWIGD